MTVGSSISAKNEIAPYEPASGNRATIDLHGRGEGFFLNNLHMDGLPVVSRDAQDSEGAGDDASSPLARGTAPGGPRRSPAPEGPDGLDREDDEDPLPILSLIDGDIAMQPFPWLGSVRVLTPDQAARFAAKLTEFALTARQISTKPT